MTNKKIIKLVRLRMPKDNYEHLNEILELVKNHGSNVLSPENKDWLVLRTKWQKQNIEGIYVGDIKSTLFMMGLIDTISLTKFGDDILKNWGNQFYVKQKLAKKLLVDMGGWAFCHILYSLPGSTREDLWEYYSEVYDPDIQEEYTDISKYNIFLTWLGIAKERGNTYEFNLDVFEKLLGLGINEMELLSEKLSEEARYCYMALIRMDNQEGKYHQTKDIRKVASTIFGKHIDTHKMYSYAMELKTLGLIEYGHRGATSRQRGQVGEWKLNYNEKYTEVVTKLLSDFFESKPDWNLKETVSMTFREINKKLQDTNIDIKGKALELFASKICWKLGIRGIKRRWQEEGVELDVTGIKSYPFYETFLIQCKNKATSVGAPVIAKELGTAFKEKFNNIMIFSTSGFTSNVRIYSKEAMVSTGVNIYLIDKIDIDLICDNENELLDVLKRENKMIESVRSNNSKIWDSLKQSSSSE